MRRNGTQLYFAILTWLGAETETYRQTNDDSDTYFDDIEIVEAVLKRREAAESDDYIHIVQPYRFEPYHAMPDGVNSAIAAGDAN